MIRSVVLLGCAALLAFGCGSSGDGGAAPAPAPSAEPAPAPTLAEQIAVDEIAVYQGVKTLVVKDGEAVAKRNAPVIAGRPALVRVFVKATGRAPSDHRRRAARAARGQGRPRAPGSRQACRA